MKAIVLTFDKYKVFTDHMIECYQNLWPENPFIFRIPYQSEEVKDYFIKKYGNKVELIKAPSNIIETISALLSEFDDEDWVYWCLDDRYPMELNTSEIYKVYNWIKTIKDKDISAIRFINSRFGQDPKNIYYDKKPIKDIHNNKYWRRKNYILIWIHQFIKVKVIRNIFAQFPKDMKSAKEMDHYLDKMILPENHKLYVLNKNIGKYGESTSRGKITRNCYKSLLDKSMIIPENFELSDKSLVFGGNNSVLSELIFWTKVWLRTIIKNLRNNNK